MRYRPKSIIYTVNCKPTLAFGEDKEERQWNLMEMEETMTYCATGANGYVGSWFAKSLLERGYTVRAIILHSIILF